MSKIYLSQKTLRQVVKRLSLSYVYEVHFGTFGTVQTNNTGLNHPCGIASDGTYIYVCDNNNKRIVKLDAALTYVSSVSVAAQVGRPFAICYDSISGDLYISGIMDYITISIARITTALTIVKSNNNILAAEVNNYPLGISLGLNSGELIISGLNNLYKVIETGSFSSATIQTIIGEAGIQFTGHIKHSNGDLYLIKQKPQGSWICRVTSGYVNNGDSDKLSKEAIVVTQGDSNSLLIFDIANSKVSRYDENLNWIEFVYQNTGTTVQLDAKEIYGITEF